MSAEFILTTHIPHDEPSVDMLNIYLSSLSLFHYLHPYLGCLTFASKNCVGGLHRTGSCYLFFVQKWLKCQHTLQGSY